VEIGLSDYSLITRWLLWQEVNRLSDYILSYSLAPLGKERISLSDRTLNHLLASIVGSKSSIKSYARLTDIIGTKRP
jgi:hypothetical protein